MINLHTHTASPFGLLNTYPTDKTPTQAFSCGFHPLYLEDIETNWSSFLEKVQHPRCLAIGECGIDKRSTFPIEIQENIAKRQFELAAQQNKPVILHAVKATDNLLRLCAPFQQQTSFIVHGFNNKPTLMETYIKHGFYLSLGAALLQENSNAQACLKSIPLNRLFLETDASHEQIQTIYTAAANVLKIPVATLIKQIQHNFDLLFHEKL